MKTLRVVALSTATLLSAIAFGDPPAPTTLPPAPEEQKPPSHESDEIGKLAQRAQLSTAIVQKLSPEQLASILQQHAMDRDHNEGIVVPVAFFVALLFMIAVPLYFQFRRERIRHESIRALIEKGQPIPREMLTPPTQRSDLRRGLTLVGAGIGLALLLIAIPEARATGAWASGAIPLLVGIGYLVAWRIEGRATEA
jgi:hypothetical protein